MFIDGKDYLLTNPVEIYIWQMGSMACNVSWRIGAMDILGYIRRVHGGFASKKFYITSVIILGRRRKLFGYTPTLSTIPFSVETLIQTKGLDFDIDELRRRYCNDV